MRKVYFEVEREPFAGHEDTTLDIWMSYAQALELFDRLRTQIEETHWLNSIHVELVGCSKVMKTRKGE